MNDLLAITGIKSRDERRINEIIEKYSKLKWMIVSAVLKNVGTEQDVEECVAAVNALTVLEKDILIRRYFYEQNPKEIEKALDIPRKQVENHLYRSKQKLKKSVSVC